MTYNTECCDNCEQCDQVCEVNNTPYVSLGCCLKWDTTCTKVEGQEQWSEGSNVGTLKKFVKEKKGQIAWYSECHGRTLVCMHDICHLKHAMGDDILSEILCPATPESCLHNHA